MERTSVWSIPKYFGIEDSSKRACSFAFSSKTVPSEWEAFTFDLPIAKPIFYLVIAKGAKLEQIKAFASGIAAENYVLIVDRGEDSILVLRRSKKGDNAPLLIPLWKEDDYERVVNVVREHHDFLSDELSAHSCLNDVIDILKGGAPIVS